MENFSQLCVWEGTILKNEEKEITFEEFENWISENFNGVRIKMMEEIKTLPDVENGKVVPETGGIVTGKRIVD